MSHRHSDTVTSNYLFYMTFQELTITVIPMTAVIAYWFSLRRLYQEWEPWVWLKTLALSSVFILLDQSRSMSEPVAGIDSSKADYAATALNELIYAMIDQTPIDEETGERRKYVYLSVLGYSDEVVSLLSPDGQPIDLTELANHPLGRNSITREVYDPETNGFKFVRDPSRPYWIKPGWINSTQTDKAFMRARDLVREWIGATPEHGQAPHIECFPPVIIHITDGEDNGMYDPEPIAYEIRSEGTHQGATLIFNCHFTTNTMQPCSTGRTA